MITRQQVQRAFVAPQVIGPDWQEGVVDGLDPLRVRIGQHVIDATPSTLVAPSMLGVGMPVWCQQQPTTGSRGGRLLILGIIGGVPIESLSGAGLITLESGFTLTSLSLRRVGSLAQIALRVTRSTDIPAGNHSNIPVGTLSASAPRPVLVAALTSTYWASCLGNLGASGGIEISSTIATVTAGDPIDLVGTYITS